jgi:hypothetical protein
MIAAIAFLFTPLISVLSTSVLNVTGFQPVASELKPQSLRNLLLEIADLSDPDKHTGPAARMLRTEHLDRRDVKGTFSPATDGLAKAKNRMPAPTL